ncbi:MAG: cupin domain-containing protein [Spirochaetales bacterium]|nr:cupin domain-containing protein [Spirochaetales bacterium]
MGVFHLDATASKYFDNENMKKVTKQVLIDGEKGWESHVMRLFTLAEGGYSPKHQHPWPHIAFIISGEGILHIDGEDTPVRFGSYAFVPPGSNHQFRNTGSGDMKFICIVPTEGDV